MKNKEVVLRFWSALHIW